MRFLFIVFQILLFVPMITAQKAVVTGEQIWLGYINQTRISDKWGFTADVHIRTKSNFFTDFSTGVLRAGAVYHLNDNTSLAVGHAYFHYFPADEHADISRPEHRPWQQVQWTTRYPKLRLQQRIRLEERFRRKIKDRDELGEGYNFNYRARFQMMLFLPLSKKQFTANSLSAYAGDEVLLNFGKQITYNTLDHNRLHIGLAFHVDTDDQLQFGYLNIFQQQASGTRYRMIHVARIYYQHALDLRKKEAGMR